MPKIKKSLTVICHNLVCGGTEKVITNLVYFYSKQNINTTIITFGPANIFSGFKISEKTRILELPKNSSNNIFKKLSNILIWIFKINIYIKNNNESVYLSFLTIPTIVTIISSLNKKINHYGSERINPKYVNLPFHWRFLRFITYWKMNSLIVQTKEIKNNFINYIPKRQLTIIPNSISQVIEKNEVNKEIGTRKIKILFIGRLEFQKGIDVVLESIIKIFNSKIKDQFIFEIVGNGTLCKKVENTIKNNNLSSYVRFIKGTNDPTKVIRESHIILHPSRYEGMSNVVLEAMSLGKCVISTYKASSEIIKNNKDGILIKEVSSTEIIKCLEKLSLKRKLLKEIGLNAIHKISANYLEERILKLWSKTLRLN